MPEPSTDTDPGVDEQRNRSLDADEEAVDLPAGVSSSTRRSAQAKELAAVGRNRRNRLLQLIARAIAREIRRSVDRNEDSTNVETQV